MIVKADAPKFTVIIATFNWSSALRLALESVQAQTCQDLEVLVVGDACTDDSEVVVQEFGDSRFKWCNLPENFGSQWGPNNHALWLALGKYIAYLGHDDLWWPTHLETAADVFEKSGADIVAAASLMYGPPGSGIRCVSGFFPNDIFSPRHFFPPSSMLHRKELALNIGGWRPPAVAEVAVDYDFLVRCHEAGARVIATGEFTTFKFNAAWRRDAYRLRDPFEQRQFLENMRRDGENFRRKELSTALRSANEDRLHKIEIAPDLNTKAAAAASTNCDFKGSRKALREPAKWVDGSLRVYPDEAYAGFEWHLLEQHPSLGAFRWSGPMSSSTIVVPTLIDGPMNVSALLVCWLTKETLRSARVKINDVDIASDLAAQDDGTFILRCSLTPDQFATDDLAEVRWTISVDRTCRPIDLALSDDRRWLGLAVGWLELTKGQETSDANLPDGAPA
ncbi:MAG: glycosyltransferase [Pseudomonadota bacterium]